MEGVLCDCAGCNVKDFLPFECDNCGKTFCLEHRSVFAHACEAVPASNEVGSTAHLPSVQGMFDEVSRRFDNEEKYAPKEHVAVQTSKVQVDSGVTSVAQKIDHLHAVAEHSNTKQKNISSTTRNMLMKSRAEGPLNVLVENRHHLAITFTATNQLRYLYFSKHASIGECLQYIASHLPLLAFNTNQPAPSLTLTCQTSTITWEEINHNNPIYTIDCYSDVEVICKPTSDVVAAQRRLQEQVESSISTSQSEILTVNIPTFNVNDTVVYTASSGEKQLATIVAIHRDDITPYYTVNLSSTKQDRQTDHLHLQPYLISASDTRTTDCIKVSIKKKVVHIAPICTNDSVLVLKKAIEVQTLIPVKQQKLIYKGKVLKDGQTLSSAGIALGNTVTLMSATVA